MSETIYVILFALVMYLAYSSIRIAQENERFAVFVLGRFWKFKGPGIVLTAQTMKLVRLAVGDLGTVTGPEFIKFGDTDIPIGQASSFEVGDSVRILSFDDDGPLLTLTAEKPTQQCPNCGHEF